MRIILVVATINHWELKQLDIKNVFLHRVLQEEAYIKQPRVFVDPTCPNHVYKLIKSFYGLKQTPRAWSSKFTSYVCAMGFQTSLSDTSLFTKNDDTDIIILLLYVDDIILTDSNSTKIHQVIKELSEVFGIKNLGKLTYFLGLQIKYQSNRDIFVNQSKYIKDLMHKVGMESCKPATTPCKPHDSLLIIEGILLSDPTFYRSIVGSLQYLTFTRLNIAFTVNLYASL